MTCRQPLCFPHLIRRSALRWRHFLSRGGSLNHFLCYGKLYFSTFQHRPVVIKTASLRPPEFVCWLFLSLPHCLWVRLRGHCQLASAPTLVGTIAYRK
ncbi:hypothetical protein Y032_0439g1489 [Ancylostoma ceylanicum]|uniref:Uncharacterized protein n=1 Tax=Ancylostoma ceylanicum TaxID=53326 RepID=A0A016WZS7_9BILA|nr:hypothetical protein Y032_0439g1489 [Ancylostoma ceylanicum]